MPIVIDVGHSVQAYIAALASGLLVIPRPRVCPHCQALDALIGHGFYTRKALDQERVYRVRIRRWYCKACRRTLAMLPSFLLRFRHYLLAVIQQVLLARYEDYRSWAQVERQCAPQQAPSRRTIIRWCHSFAAQAPRWLAAVLLVLAQHDTSSPLLDPLGQSTGPPDAPRALLQAAVHLLAWAKTQRPELVADGRQDRLRFLWHWGAARGLGRLL